MGSPPLTWPKHTLDFHPKPFPPPVCPSSENGTAQSPKTRESSLKALSLPCHPALSRSCQAYLPRYRDLTPPLLPGLGRPPSHLDLGCRIPSSHPASCSLLILLFTQQLRDPFKCKFYPGFSGPALQGLPITLLLKFRCLMWSITPCIVWTLPTSLKLFFSLHLQPQWHSGCSSTSSTMHQPPRTCTLNHTYFRSSSSS